MKFKRIIQSTVAVLIVLLFGTVYSDHNGQRFLIDIIMPYQPFRAILVVVLIFIAYKLIDSKPKDYSKFFYNVLVRLFGDPTKKHKS